MRVLLIVALAILAASSAAQADTPPGTPRLTVPLGRSVDLKLVVVQTICDDLSIVRVEAVEQAIRLTGLKEGSTLCSFWQSTAFRRLYEVVVTPPAPRKP